jgi:transposase
VSRASSERKIEPLLARLAVATALCRSLRRSYSLCNAKEYAQLKVEIQKIEAKLMAWHKHNELSRRLLEVPTIGPTGASLVVMKVPDPHAFRSGRDFSPWIGLAPKDHSTAGKTRLGVITRAGDETLRSTLILGAPAIIQQVRRGRGHPSPWLIDRSSENPACYR